MQPLEICKFNMQSDGWKVADSRRKHKQTLSRPRSQVLSPSRQHHPPPPTAAAYSEGADGGSPFSFNSLPAIALASIFQHLDSTSGCNLSQTCCACALEFAQQRDEFAQKCCSELVPTVTRDSPKGRDPYGSKHNPVSLHVTWEEEPGPALRRIHATSHQPVFINQLWRKAWPRSLWSDLMVDGMSEAWPVLVRWGNHEWESKLYIHVTIQIASGEFLQLPWTWLALCLLYGPAAGLTYYLNTNAPPQLQTQGKQYYVSLRRPAQATETQLVMYKTFIQSQRHLVRR